jgi:uncharacterized membrane protein
VASMFAVVSSASAARYRILDLGTLGGPTSAASAINDLGEVTGAADTSVPVQFQSCYMEPGVASHAFRFSAGSMTGLTPGSGACFSRGSAINNLGDVVGVVGVYGGDFVAGLWAGNGSFPAVSPDPPESCRPINLEAPMAG